MYESSGGTGSKLTERQRSGYSPDFDVRQRSSSYHSRDVDLTVTAKPRGLNDSRDLAPHTPISAPARTDAIRRRLNRARIVATQIEEFRKEKTLMELSNSGFALVEILSDLWDLRGDREEEFGDLINLLQGVLNTCEFEQLSVEQCEVIRRIVEEHVASGSVDDTDLEECVVLLGRAGLDPFKPISETNGE